MRGGQIGQDLPPPFLTDCHFGGVVLRCLFREQKQRIKANDPKEKEKGAHGSPLWLHNVASRLMRGGGTSAFFYFLLFCVFYFLFLAKFFFLFRFVCFFPGNFGFLLDFFLSLKNSSFWP